jgi:hypothetical protein
VGEFIGWLLGELVVGVGFADGVFVVGFVVGVCVVGFTVSVCVVGSALGVCVVGFAVGVCVVGSCIVGFAVDDLRVLGLRVLGFLVSWTLRNRGTVPEMSLFFSTYDVGFGDIAHAKVALNTPATIKKGSAPKNERN